MLKIKILCVGKIKEKYFAEAVSEYVKRISRFAEITVKEIREENFTTDPSPLETEKIIATEGEQCESEGCLSNPGGFGITKRPRAVTVRATDRHGNEYELRGTDLLARAICHECDHLDGKLYTDVEIRREK